MKKIDKLMLLVEYVEDFEENYFVDGYEQYFHITYGEIKGSFEKNVWELINYYKVCYIQNEKKWCYVENLYDYNNPKELYTKEELKVNWYNLISQYSTERL